MPTMLPAVKVVFSFYFGLAKAYIGGAGRYIAANDEVLKENLADGDGLIDI